MGFPVYENAMKSMSEERFISYLSPLEISNKQTSATN